MLIIFKLIQKSGYWTTSSKQYYKKFKICSDMLKLQATIIGLILVSTALSTLMAYMPACALNQITAPINYTLANFGHIPYGRTIIGEVLAPKYSQFCNYEQTEDFAKSSSDDVRKFVLVKRGDCKFTKKILNAQKRGADLVIVYDNEKTATPFVVMSNDGHGHLIDIPSIFISGFDGDKLIKTYQKCNKGLMLKIQFDIFTSKVANLTFWIDINNRESFITIRDFYRDYFNVIAPFIDFDLKFKINQNCAKHVCNADDCIKNKEKYCLHSDRIVGGVTISGKQLISEHLRSYYLFENAKKTGQLQKWFQYMIRFDESICIEKLDLRDCSLTILKQLDNIQNIEAKVSETLTNATEDKPHIMEDFVSSAYSSDILFYPEASINGRNFYGLFRAPDIFQMVCSSLERPPKQCHSFSKTDDRQIIGNDPSTGLWKTIMLIILFAVLLFFAVLFIYNRLIRKEMNQQMSMQVNKMVQHYVAMTQQKSRSNADM